MARRDWQAAGLLLCFRGDGAIGAERTTLGFDPEGYVPSVEADEVRPGPLARSFVVRKVGVEVDEAADAEEVVGEQLCLRLAEEEADRALLGRVELGIPGTAPMRLRIRLDRGHTRPKVAAAPTRKASRWRATEPVDFVVDVRHRRCFLLATAPAPCL